MVNFVDYSAPIHLSAQWGLRPDFSISFLQRLIEGRSNGPGYEYVIWSYAQLDAVMHTEVSVSKTNVSQNMRYRAYLSGVL